eukprot:gene4759-6673_t
MLFLYALISLFVFTASFSFHGTKIVKRNTYVFQIKSTPSESTSSTIDIQPVVTLDPEEELINRIRAEVFAESGVELDQLINPSKVVNLERDILKLSKELEQSNSQSKILEIENKISKKRATLAIEKRAVMRGWLKNLFVGQSVLAGGISLLMVYDAVPGIQTPLAVQVLGFWMWWLFIIPSLRARKPVDQEKEALNVAFLASPLVSLVMPVATKDIPTIWWANFIVVGLCYAYGFLKPSNENDLEATDNNDDNNDNNSSSIPSVLIKAFKALDYGSGQERGARK